MSHNLAALSSSPPSHPCAPPTQTVANPGLLVDVSRLLLRAALEVPHNQQFLLLSEYCVPLYPPQVVWQQLASEQRSRVNACNGVRSRSTGGGGDKALGARPRP